MTKWNEMIWYCFIIIIWLSGYPNLCNEVFYYFNCFVSDHEQLIHTTISTNQNAQRSYWKHGHDECCITNESNLSLLNAWCALLRRHMGVKASQSPEIHCLLNSLFSDSQRKYPSIVLHALSWGNPQLTHTFPSHRIVNAESAFISWVLMSRPIVHNAAAIMSCQYLNNRGP